MKRLSRIYFFGLGLALGAMILALPLIANAQAPTTTTFTYQGRLIRSGDYVDNFNCNFQFSLYGTLSGGASLGGVQVVTALVSDGYFTVNLDFGDQFNGDPRYLETAVQCPGDTGFTTLTPRVTLYAAPYAHSAARAPWTGITGMPAGFADGTDDGQTYTAGTGITIGSNNVISATFAGNGTAGTVARSDHNHDTIYLTIAEADTRFINTTENAGGDLSGTFSNLQIVTNTVGMREIIATMGSGSINDPSNRVSLGTNTLFPALNFTPGANGQCLVIATVDVYSTGTQNSYDARVYTAKRTATGDSYGSSWVFMAASRTNNQILSTTVTDVMPVTGGEATSFGCSLFANNNNWTDDEYWTCNVSYLCQ